jgi:NAD(P)-dependent dehydrogenase (short-subunit alcohol dehydrogenase family)
MYPSLQLCGKVALVTGGAGGIGFGMADALAQAGADVVLWDQSEKVGEAAEALSRHGGRTAGFAVDVTQEESVVRGMEAVVEFMGRIDTVIACAGVLGVPTPYAETTLEQWRHVQSVNVEGAFLTFRESARHMVARARTGDRGGSLIGLASLAAFHGAPGAEAYSCSKAAVGALMRSLAAEYGRYGIRANAIAPGWIATAMTNDMLATDALAGRVLSRLPIRRWGAPSDFGGLAIYLASDCSSYHTGDMICVDGGYLVY